MITSDHPKKVERIAVNQLQAVNDGEVVHVEAIGDEEYAIAHTQDALVYGTLVQDGDVVSHQIRANGDSILLDGETLEPEFSAGDET